MNFPGFVFTFSSGSGLAIPSGYEILRKSLIILAVTRDDPALKAEFLLWGPWRGGRSPGWVFEFEADETDRRVVGGIEIVGDG